MAKPLELGPPVSAAEPPTSGYSWPLQSWDRYVQSRPLLVQTIHWQRPLTFIVRGHADPCAGGSWARLSIQLLNHGTWGHTPAYLWVIGMAVCQDRAALAMISATNVQVLADLLWVNFCEFCVTISRLISENVFILKMNEKLS